MRRYFIARYALEHITITAESEEEAMQQAENAQPSEWNTDEHEYMLVGIEDE